MDFNLADDMIETRSTVLELQETTLRLAGGGKTEAHFMGDPPG